MNFKVGDRVKAKLAPEIKATVLEIKEDTIFIKLDRPIENLLNGPLNVNDFVDFFELMDDSDWMSIWDSSSD